ncbi:small nuclear RNA activating complex, polypeptide 3 [Dissophora globulifera]|nr:small nuclear RNA activating complex, polypeptide 3 [Dissophora globulifera]
MTSTLDTPLHQLSSFQYVQQQRHHNQHAAQAPGKPAAMVDECCILTHDINDFCCTTVEPTACCGPPTRLPLDSSDCCHSPLAQSVVDGFTVQEIECCIIESAMKEGMDSECCQDLVQPGTVPARQAASTCCSEHPEVLNDCCSTCCPDTLTPSPGSTSASSTTPTPASLQASQYFPLQLLQCSTTNESWRSGDTCDHVDSHLQCSSNSNSAFHFLNSSSNRHNHAIASNNSSSCSSNSSNSSSDIHRLHCPQEPLPNISQPGTLSDSSASLTLSSDMMDAAQIDDMIRCLWEGCTAAFLSQDDLLPHVSQLHVPMIQEEDHPHCHWGTCVTEQQDPDKLLQHLRADHHIVPMSSAIPGTDILRPEPKLPSLQQSVDHRLDWNESSSVETDDTLQEEQHYCGWKGCNRVFSNFDSLTSHLSEDHIGTGKSEYVCDWEGCERNGRGFGQRQKAMRHIQTHTGDKPYQCHLCKKRFSESNIMAQHMRTHTGEKPFKCPHPGCGREFSISGALTIHRRVHSGEKPFKCRFEGCDKWFAESSNLTKHLRVHTGERPFPCPFPGCEKRFSRPDQVTRHRRTHMTAAEKAMEKMTTKAFIKSTSGSTSKSQKRAASDESVQSQGLSDGQYPPTVEDNGSSSSSASPASLIDDSLDSEGAQPQSDLFPILPFAINFQRVIQEQEDHDRYHEYFTTFEEEQEVAQRCDVSQDLQDTDRFFKDPTVFSLLKEWNESKVEGRREAADKTLRPTWASFYGQAEEVTEFGDPANLHSLEQLRPPIVGDDQVRRLLSAPTRGHRRIPFKSGRIMRKQRPKKRLFDEQDDTPADDASNMSDKTPRSTAVEIEVASRATLDSRTPAVSGAASSSTPASSSGVTDAANDMQDTEASSRQTSISPLYPHPQQAMPPPPPPLVSPAKRKAVPSQKTVKQDLDLDVDGLGERAEVEGKFVKTHLENEFQELSLIIDDCTLKSLQDESRFEVPVASRPPMNYLTLPPTHYGQPYKPVVEREPVVLVTLYSALRPTQKQEEYLFLGSQPLTAIRDAFFCLSDFASRGASELPESALTKDTMSRKTSNSFMFIEGVFYNDTPLLRAKIDKRNELKEKERERVQKLIEKHRQRSKEALDRRKRIKRGKRVPDKTTDSADSQPGREDERGDGNDMDMDSDLQAEISRCGYEDVPVDEIQVEHQEEYEKVSLDYSQVILDWIKADPKREATPGFRDLEKKYMHETLIQDLSIRINQPYLLVHQGNCEHIMMFRDLSHQHDELNRLSYPKATFKAKVNRHKCSMCHINSAFCVTLDDRLAGKTPAYFCERCYDLFHYDSSGNILYDDFKVFEYAKVRK